MNKIELIVYRKKDSNYEFLLLKRTKEKGGFWQPLTGGIEPKETKLKAVKRELEEETGIKEVANIRKIYEFVLEGTKIKEYVFSAELKKEQLINLNNYHYQEHDEYKWSGYEKAMKLLKWNGNKEALKILNNILKNKS